MMQKKDHSISIVRMKDIWHENVTDLNSAVPAERQVIDGISVLTLDVINIMKWVMWYPSV